MTDLSALFQERRTEIARGGRIQQYIRECMGSGVDGSLDILFQSVDRIAEEDREMESVIDEELRRKHKELAARFLALGKFFNEWKQQTALEHIYSLAQEHLHMSSNHVMQLMLYAERYGEMPFEQIPWKETEALIKLVYKQYS